LSETDSRIVLWRNTIQLFHTYRKQNFQGPFYISDLTNYRVESPLAEKKTGKTKTPDIFACGSRGWLVIELTCDGSSKKVQLDTYKNLDSRSLSTYGCSAYPLPPDTMSSRLSFNNDGDHCQMVVKDKFDVKNEQFIQDSVLRNALSNMVGTDLKRLPEIPLNLVPEMKNFEIRRGLIDIVLQLFDSKSKGKTPYQMCEEGLERLFNLVPQSSKQSLIDKIKQEMDVLISHDLSGYLEFRDGKYQLTEKFRAYPKSRAVVAMKLKEWANPSQRTIADYGSHTD